MGIAEELEAPQCVKCKWKNPEEFLCAAYPWGIHYRILQNKVLHDHVLEDQFGDNIYTEAD
jgi:hypothetical protein